MGVKTIAAVLLAALGYSQTLDDVVFEIKAMRSPAIYRIGEPIELELTFSTASAGKYGITGTSENRDACPITESFAISPASGAVDPFDSRVGGIAGDFLSTQSPLTAERVVRHAELNQWLRFTEPGRYTLRATSPRIFAIAAPRTELLVRSNEIELTVLEPDAEWTSKQLSEIAGTLDGPENPEQKVHAAHRLRYLGTEAASVEMARRYVSETASPELHAEFYFGLTEAAHPEAAIPILRARLLDTQSTVDSNVIRLLATLVPGRDSTEKPEERQKRYNALVAKYTAEVLASLHQRTGRAHAGALYALWEEQESRLANDTPAPENLLNLRVNVVASVNELSRAQQNAILDFYWDRLPNRPLLPFVRQIAMHGDEYYARQLAFKRWCELDLGECEQALLAEIRNPQTSLQTPALLILPAKERPELDAILGKRLRQSKTDERTAALIQRYASKALADQVRDVTTEPLSGPVEICNTTFNLLAYLLRVDPEMGLAAVEASMKRRGVAGGCYRYLLTSVAELRFVPGLSKIAEAAVRVDPDGPTAGNAALMLSVHGPASAEALIWERFEAWSEKWRTHATELERTSFGENPLQDEVIFENNVMQALAQPKAWTASHSDYDRLAGLCVTESCRTTVKSQASTAPFSIP